MNKFLFKSTAADLQKFNSIMITKLELLNKNILYVTYQVDKILKIEQDNMTDKGLQKQVDEYFEDDAEEIAEQVPETSPQTDTDDKEPD